MSTTDRPATGPAPGWYVHPHTGQPAWWTGQGWTAAPPPAPTPPAVPPATPATPAAAPSATPASTPPAAPSWAPQAQAGGAVDQFGFPVDATYASPSRPVSGTVRMSGSSGSGRGTWLVVTVVALVAVVGGLLVFRGLGRTAQAETQTGQQAIKQATDSDAKQALVNAAQAMETWYSDHQNYAVRGPITGISRTAHVAVASTAQGYCLRAYTTTGSAQGPANGSWFWYDSQGGGLQPVAGPSSPSAATGGACAGAATFTPLN